MKKILIDLKYYGEDLLDELSVLIQTVDRIDDLFINSLNIEEIEDEQNEDE